VLLPTYHPAAALYKPDLRGLLEKDLEEAAKLVKRGRQGRRTLLDFM